MIGDRPRSSGRSVGLAVLLVGTLLLCHGVFGFAHEIPHDTSTDLLASISQAGHEHGPDHAAGHAAGDEPSKVHSFAGYFAIVLALVGVALLGLLRGAWRGHGGEILPLRRLRLVRAFALPPRGPTLPLLQVFRL